MRKTALGVLAVMAMIVAACGTESADTNCKKHISQLRDS